MSAGEDKRHAAVTTRLARAARLLDAAFLLSPENFADWLEHLDMLFDNIDNRLGYIEKRLAAAGIPLLADGIPDEEVRAYFAMYTVNPVTGTDITDAPMELQHRLAALRTSGEEASK